MKTLYEYILQEEECGMMTPSNTMGAGEPGFDTDGFISAPLGGTPKQSTHITRRRKKKKSDLRDYPMTGPKHNT